MNIKLITVCSHPEHAGLLIRSAEKFGWDLTVIQCEWKGFGTKLVATYEYLKEHPEIERFVFCDAFDVVVLGTPEEFENKMEVTGGFERIRLSTEKGLWPPYLQPFKSRYTGREPFKFVNSGLYYSTATMFIGIVDDYPVQYETDDQFWMNMVWLLRNPAYNELGISAILDCSQSIFNSHSFIADEEYIYENGRVKIMGNTPCFVHSNGGTKDPKLDEMLKEIGLI